MSVSRYDQPTTARFDVASFVFTNSIPIAGTVIFFVSPECSTSTSKKKPLQ
jgi:hypothetical protein